MATVTESNAVRDYQRLTALWERKTKDVSLAEQHFWNRQFQQGCERIVEEYGIPIERVATLWLEWVDKVEALQEATRQRNAQEGK